VVVLGVVDWGAVCVAGSGDVWLVSDDWRGGLVAMNWLSFWLGFGAACAATVIYNIVRLVRESRR